MQEELRDKLFTQIYRKLSQQVLHRQHEQDSAWLMQSAEAARIENILQQAAMYKRGQTQNAEEV